MDSIRRGFIKSCYDSSLAKGANTATSAMEQMLMKLCFANATARRRELKKANDGVTAPPCVEPLLSETEDDSPVEAYSAREQRVVTLLRLYDVLIDEGLSLGPLQISYVGADRDIFFRNPGSGRSNPLVRTGKAEAWVWSGACRPHLAPSLICPSSQRNRQLSSTPSSVTVEQTAQRQPGKRATRCRKLLLLDC